MSMAKLREQILAIKASPMMSFEEKAERLSNLFEGRTGKTHMLVFDSYGDQIDEFMKVSSQIRPGDDVGRSRRWIPGTERFDESYVGRKFNSWKDVRQAAESPWPEGLKIIEEMLEELRDTKLPRPQAIRRQRAWSEDDGDEICLDRLRKQVPFWRTTHRDHRPGPLSVTIVTDLSTPRDINHDKIMWRGAACICLTEMLEQAGYRVELWNIDLSLGGHANGEDFCAAVNLKTAHDPIDRSTLVNALSGWSFRSITFGCHWLVGVPDKELGLVANPKSMLKQITQDEKALLCRDVWSLENAIAWVSKQLSLFDPQGVGDDG